MKLEKNEKTQNIDKAIYNLEKDVKTNTQKIDEQIRSITREKQNKLHDLEKQIKELQQERDKEIEHIKKHYENKLSHVKQVIYSVLRKKNGDLDALLNVKEFEFLQYGKLVFADVNDTHVLFHETKYDYKKREYVTTGRSVLISKTIFHMSDREIASLVRKTLRENRQKLLFNEKKKKEKLFKEQQKLLLEAELELEKATKAYNKQVAKTEKIVAKKLEKRRNAQ